MKLILFLTVFCFAIPLIGVVGKLLFGSVREFCEACESLFVNDLSAAMWGDDRDPKPGKFLLAIFVLFAVVATVTIYYLVSRYLFGNVEPWRA